MPLTDEQKRTWLNATAWGLGDEDDAPDDPAAPADDLPTTDDPGEAIARAAAQAPADPVIEMSSRDILKFMYGLEVDDEGDK